MKAKGKFWPHARALIWEKAQQLYQEDQARRMNGDFKGLTATKWELREDGYFYQAKLVVLRDLWRKKRGLLNAEEEEAVQIELQQKTEGFSSSPS